MRQVLTAVGVVGLALTCVATQAQAQAPGSAGQASVGSVAEAAPAYQLPFPCNETWYMSSYAGHDAYAIDFHATSEPPWV